ncbi:MAG TPA: hypothetical protein VM432_02295 [Bdellovibrionales bacterium]|nr:hypothetical protein [Bdellovibrionales bacterium]
MHTKLITIISVSLSIVTSSLAYAQQAATVISYPAATPNPNAEITKNQRRARQLFTAVTGVSISIDDDRVAKMAAAIDNGKIRDASKIATSDKSFYNIRLMNLGKAMSNREETNQVAMNDFVATFIGAVRDDMDARELLTGNFYYQVTVPHDKIKGYAANTNFHYGSIEALKLSPYDALSKVTPQVGIYGPIADTDAAGLITTRAFMISHASAGTNRRIVEYTFRQFMCVAMEDWMDSTRPDDFVGRDVDRYAGGGTARYQTTCKACHAQLDGFRQAFTYFDFYKGVSITPLSVRKKMANNSHIFPQGFVTVDDRFVNYATGAANTDRFGWRSPDMRGQGPNDFGRMIANSKGYSRCLTKRMFREVCGRMPSSKEESIVRTMADEFEKTYRIPDLAAIVAEHPTCLGAQ